MHDLNCSTRRCTPRSSLRVSSRALDVRACSACCVVEGLMCIVGVRVLLQTRTTTTLTHGDHGLKTLRSLARLKPYQRRAGPFTSSQSSESTSHSFNWSHWGVLRTVYTWACEPRAVGLFAASQCGCEKLRRQRGSFPIARPSLPCCSPSVVLPLPPFVAASTTQTKQIEGGHARWPRNEEWDNHRPSFHDRTRLRTLSSTVWVSCNNAVW